MLRLSTVDLKISRLTMAIALSCATALAGCSANGYTATGTIASTQSSPEYTEIPTATSEFATEATVTADNTAPPTSTLVVTATASPNETPTASHEMSVSNARLIRLGQIGLDVFWSADSHSVYYQDSSGTPQSSWSRRDVLSGETVEVDLLASLPESTWDAIPGLPPYSEIATSVLMESLSPSGKKVLAVRDHPDIPEGELIEIDISTGSFRSLPQSPGACAFSRGLVPVDWSETENKAVIGCATAGGLSISFVDLTQGIVLEPMYFVGEETLQFHTLSPDGGRYAYTSQDQLITILDVGSTLAERVIYPVGATTPFDWATNSRLFLVQNETSEPLGCTPLGLSVYDLDSDETSLVVEFPLIDDSGAEVDALCRRPFKVSPDGHSVLFLSPDGVYVLLDLLIT